MAHYLYSKIGRLILICNLFVVNLLLAQTASGSINFVTDNGQTTSISATATALFDSAISYNLSGDANNAISFSAWTLDNALSVGDVALKNKLQFFKNPAAHLNIALNFADSGSLKAAVFDLNGKVVGKPKIIKQANGTVQIYHTLNALRDGIYLVKIQSDTFSGSLKFVKMAAAEQNLQSHYQKSQKTNLSLKSTGTPNYNISWSAVPGIADGNIDVEIIDSNTIIIPVTTIYDEAQTGDVAIITRLNGLPKDNTTITLTNTQVRDSTYAIDTSIQQPVFYNVYVSNGSNPTTYEVKIVDNLADGTFEETITNIAIFQDVNREGNGNKTVTLTPIANSQDITVFARDYKTLVLNDHADIYLIRDDNNTTIDTQVTDAAGKVTFKDVPGETSYHLQTSEGGSYAITFGSFTTPKVDHISEQKDTLNLTTVNYIYDRTNAPMFASIIQQYKPSEDNTEFALGHLRVYFPPAAQRQLVVDEFSTVATELGMPNAIIPYDTPFATPTQAQIDGYNPYPTNREVYPGLIGTNITSYSGTGTGNYVKTLSNGNKITFFATGFNLGGLNWARTDHEIGNLLGFKIFGNASSAPTSRNPDGGSSVSIADSPHDSALMPLWIREGVLHYNTTDAQGRLMNYAMPKKFE